MAEAEIPVDLFNPGQVFACLGFLEAADILLGDAEGAFDWHDTSNIQFRLCAAQDQNPVEAVLRCFAEAEIRQFRPLGYLANDSGAGEEATNKIYEDENEVEGKNSLLDVSDTFPAKTASETTLPIRIVSNRHPAIELSHWTDDSSRNTFKLYAGNRSAFSIACAMLNGTHKKPSKEQRKNSQQGDLKTKGLKQFWYENESAFIEDPFGVLTSMSGSFNFDPRGGWTAIDAGYSPNDQKDAVEASPVVELLAALGLQHARPVEYGVREVRYAVWGLPLSPPLARVALLGAMPPIPMRQFHFMLALSGKNKIVTFSEEEIRS